VRLPWRQKRVHAKPPKKVPGAGGGVRNAIKDQNQVVKGGGKKRQQPRVSHRGVGHQAKQKAVRQKGDHGRLGKGSGYRGACDRSAGETWPGGEGEKQRQRGDRNREPLPVGKWNMKGGKRCRETGSSK